MRQINEQSLSAIGSMFAKQFHNGGNGRHLCSLQLEMNNVNQNENWCENI